MENKAGIFIRSSLPMVEVINHCSHFLKQIDSRANIDTVCTDSGGVKIFFSDPSVVPRFLRKKYISDAACGDFLLIYPAKTNFVLHQAIPDSDVEFVEKLKKSMEKKWLHRVLEVVKIPLPSHPNIASGDWRITIDTPEIENSEIFKKEGFPNESRVQISPGVEYKLTFWCSSCEKSGHSTSKCPEAYEEIKSESRQQDVKTAGTEHSLKKQVFNADSALGHVSERNLEDFKRELGQEEAERYTKHTPWIKQEKLDEGDFSQVHPVSSKKFAIDLRTEKVVSKIHRRGLLKRMSPVDEDQCSTDHSASSTTGGVEMKYTASSNAKRLDIHLDSGHTAKESPKWVTHSVKTLQDNRCDPGPSHYPTSSQLDAHPSGPPSPHHDSRSGPTPRSTPRKRKPSTILPVKLPARIRAIVERQEHRELDVAQLEAFFTHAKKKSRISEVALRYTGRQELLRGQLRVMQSRYYASNEISAPEDIQFMKWFDAFLKRMDGAAPARRRKKATKPPVVVISE